ncbi:hypothetical protein FJW04_17820 [Mesorhizobium sp. B2-7-3]|uniref:hypothetical protein n=1 Tax=Mesorhizobium sp. B2-7-3 TaxID=2589907 RepID=UPI00112A0619|nr:hypothetical protein [Mesorhizobium sp. B2-7-3]TPJ14346.1 hypothetical protein FJW04_17820 [Mesorhizobium sp. B2-7-3]
MADGGDILRLTRRGFLCSAGAVLGAAALAQSQTAAYPFLLIETLYVQRQNGPEYLAGIRLRLRRASHDEEDEKSLTIRGSDFVASGAEPPKVRLSGLTILARDSSEPVPSDTRLTLTVSGVDLFNHRNADVGGACTYAFTISADVQGSGDHKSVVWQIGLRTNAWVHRDLVHWLEFPPARFGNEGRVELGQVMDGQAGFKLDLGAGWVAETLSRITGARIEATNNHIAVLSVVPRDPDDRSNQAREWRWSVRPIYASSRLTAYDATIVFRSLRFGWGRAKAEDGKLPAESADEPTKAQFFIEVGSDEPSPKGTFPETSLLASPNGQVGLPQARFLIRGENSSYLSITGGDARAAWDTVGGRAGGFKDEPGPADMVLSGTFAVRLTSAGKLLCGMDYTFDPGEGTLRLRSAKDGHWFLNANIPPTPASRMLDLDDLLVTTESEERVDTDDQSRQVFSLAFGWLALEVQTAGKPVGTTRLPGISLNATLSRAKVESLALRATLADLPVSLAPEPGLEMFSRVIVVDPGLSPVLRLRNVELPSGLDEAEAARAGHIFLDAPAAGADGLPGLDVPLDSALVQVRRASDMLMLDFRLANLRLRSDTFGADFVVYPDPVAKPSDLMPIEYPKEAVLRADFGPQHMAEQAFARRDAIAGGLPSIDFQKLADFLAGNWPARVHDAFATLRTGSRSKKRKVRSGTLRDLAAEVARILGSVAEADSDLVTKLKDYDPRLVDRVKDFRTFAETYNKYAKSSWPPVVGRLPEDQQIYAGPDDLDPDAANLAWDLRKSDLQVILRAKLIERLISVDGSYGNAISPGLLPTIEGEIVDVVGGRGSNIAETIWFAPAPPDKAITALLEGKWADVKAQRDASPVKEQIAPDYAEFRTRWKRQAERFRSRLSQADLAEVSNFASIRWALGRSRNDPVSDLLSRVINSMVDLTGEVDEPYTQRSRARLSGPSRLVFQWSRRHDASGNEGPEAQFALNELLDWYRRDQVVPLRAQTVREADNRGNIVRSVDRGQQLRLQGFQPALDLSAMGWMDKVYAASARSPLDYETAIELPFRLQLSPAQDAVWVLPHQIDLDLSLPPDPSDPSKGLPLWSVALEPANPDPLLRAVWSEDFWPERFLNGRDRVDSAKPIDVRDKRAAELLNAQNGQPTRGAAAPWYAPRLRRRAGEIIDAVPLTVSEEERQFRASMDSYDRDQIVAESSVPGILVKRGIDPKTNQVIEGGDSYSPPDGYGFNDVALEAVLGDDGQQVARLDSSAIYAPRSLSFRELRLTGLGGTLDLHTKFKPPVSADLLDGGNLYPAFTLESWRHLAVLGRDRVVELVYKGYLFPFGHHASLVKLTERRYLQPAGNKRGPTAYLVQRLFIRCSEPSKTDWYDQPDAGRAWPVDEMRILTGQTADLVDPLPGSPSVPKHETATVLPNGRVSLDGGCGLVFWPRTAPFKGAEVPFEFQIDGLAQAHRLPMIFVDNEAANDEQTLASLITYYNQLDSDTVVTLNGPKPAGQDHRFFNSDLDRRSVRVFDQGGASRRYGQPLEEGETSYETQAWAVGVEGRPGEQRKAGAKDPLTLARGSTLRPRSNYGFSPLLLASDQPPFYPLVHFAEIRLDRLGRLLGERQGRECLVAFEANYLRKGFTDATQPASGPEPFLGILNQVILDVGARGDRVGAIGRPAGRLLLLARKEGPLTTSRDKALSEGDSDIYRNTPPDFGVDQFKSLASRASGIVSQQSNALQAVDADTSPMSVGTLLDKVLGDADMTVFGSYKLRELINDSLTGLADAVPSVREVKDYVGGAAETLIAAVRNEVLPAIRKALGEVERAFNAAAIKAGNGALELRRVYPDIGSAIGSLDNSMREFEQARDIATAASRLTAIVTAGKSLVKAFEKAGRDPVSPLKLELQRVIVADLQGVDDIEQSLSSLLKNPPDLETPLAAAQQAALMALSKKLDEPDTRSQIVAAITAVMTLPDPGSGAATLDKAVSEIVDAVYTGFLEAMFRPAPPTDLAGFLARLERLQGLQILGKALEASPTLAEIRGSLESYLNAMDAEARAYWAQLLMLRDQIKDRLAEAETARKALKQLTDNSNSDEARLHAKEEEGRLTPIIASAKDEVARLADKAARALFGCDAKALLASKDQLQQSLQRLHDEHDFSRKIPLAIELLSQIDRIFLQGRFGSAAETAMAELAAAAADQLKPVLDAILDGYTAVLDLADMFVEQSVGLDPPAALAEAITTAGAALDDLTVTIGEGGTADKMRKLVAGLAASNSNIDSDIDTLTADLQLRLDRIVKALNIASAARLSQPFGRIKQLVIELTTAMAEAAKKFGRKQSQAARKWAPALFDVYGEAVEEAHRSLVRAATAIAQARLTMTGWREPATPVALPKPGLAAAAARRAIELARRQPSVDNYHQVVKTFPRGELSALLEAWPKAIVQSVDALQDLAAKWAADTQALPKLALGLQQDSSDAEPIAVDAVKAMETAFGKFVQDEFIEVKTRVFAAGKDVAAAAAGQVATAAPRMMKRVMDARQQMSETAERYPFLAPVADSVARMADDLTNLPDTLAIDKFLASASSAADKFDGAKSIGQVSTAAAGFRTALELDAGDAYLATFRATLLSVGSQAGNRLRDEAVAQAAGVIAALEANVDQAADQAESWLLDQVFSAKQVTDAMVGLQKIAKTIRDQRNKLLVTLNDDNRRIARTIGDMLKFLKLDPGELNDTTLLPALLLTAVGGMQGTAKSRLNQKVGLLQANYTMPKDELENELEVATALVGKDTDGARLSSAQRLASLQRLASAGRSGDLAVVQIVGSLRTTMDQVLHANFAALVDFQNVRKIIEDQLRKLLPTRITTQLDYSVPLQKFPASAAIFNPIGDGRFTMRSVNSIDFSDPDNPRFDASAEALLSPFEIKLLGSFDAITLVFSAARLTWKLGGQAHFLIDFVDYRIGPALSFVDKLAAALGQSSGGAYVRLAEGFAGIEAGYKINIPAFTLGGVTFLNVGLSAGAVLPFDKRPAQFVAALSSRDDPFVIIAGVWGGGGHFQLTSDGRSITGFDASFVFGGGGGVTYGPLTMVGRVTVGVFIRKVGHFTEIAGDFFAGGSGRVAIFGISASLTVVTGMTGAGDMFGSAVFRYSFSIGFAKVSFSVTVFKKESKGFGKQQAMLTDQLPYDVADASGALLTTSATGRTARISVSTVRQDLNYRAWQRYFSPLRPEGY